MHHEVLLAAEVKTPLGSFLLAGTITDGMGVMPRRPLRVYGAYAIMCLSRGSGLYEDLHHPPVPLGVGSVVTVFPDTAHWYGPPRRRSSGERWDELYLAFDGPCFDLWRRAGLLDTRRPVSQSQPEWRERLRSFIADLAQPASLRDRYHQFARFQTLLIELMPEAGQDIFLSELGPMLPEQSQMVWTKQARGLLEDALSQPVDLAAIASATGVSYETFRKRFLRETGLSPGRYRLLKRIEAAQRLLLHAPHVTNRQVALAFGFADEFHFSRSFRQITGTSPSAFRARQEKDILEKE